MPRAENFGDLITVDHNVLNEECESIQSPVRCRCSGSCHSMTIHGNLTNFVKIYHGIIEPQHLIGPRQMVLLRERYAGLRKEPQHYCYNKDWMKSGGLILWNAFCYLRNV